MNSLPLLLIALILGTTNLSGQAIVKKRPHYPRDQAGVFYPLFHEKFQQGPTDSRYQRSIRDFYLRRAYPGAPPVIPHPAKGAPFEWSANCGSCHEFGGWVERFQAYAPVTPHPERVSCRQCHVPQAGQKEFVGTNWENQPNPRIGLSAIAGGPPPIPHLLQGRGVCLSCHAGPAAIREIRTGHPERVHCLQCHVVQSGVRAFARESGDENR